MMTNFLLWVLLIGTAVSLWVQVWRGWGEPSREPDWNKSDAPETLAISENIESDPGTILFHVPIKANTRNGKSVQKEYKQ
jgi:hypothetical protein